MEKRNQSYNIEDLNEKMDKYEAINFLCEKALDNNDVLEDFHNQVISRENLSSTCFITLNKLSIT